MLNVPAIALGIFGIATLEKKAGFLVTLFLEIMLQAGVCAVREGLSKLVDSGKDRTQVGFGVDRGH